LSKGKCLAGDGSQQNLAADHDSALARNLHLLFTAYAAFWRSRSSSIDQGQGNLESMGKSSELHDAGKWGAGAS